MENNNHLSAKSYNHATNSSSNNNNGSSRGRQGSGDQTNRLISEKVTSSVDNNKRHIQNKSTSSIPISGSNSGGGSTGSKNLIPQSQMDEMITEEQQSLEGHTNKDDQLLKNNSSSPQLLENILLDNNSSDGQRNSASTTQQLNIPSSLQKTISPGKKTLALQNTESSGISSNTSATPKIPSIIEQNQAPTQGHHHVRNILGSHSGIRGEALLKPPMVPNNNKTGKKELDKDDIEAEYLNEQKYEAEILAKYLSKQGAYSKNNSGSQAQFLPQLIINIQYTQYEVLRDVAESLDYYISVNDQEDPEWDIYWLDSMINPQFLFKMQTYQRVNHFAGMQVIARKNLLARNLQAMQRKCPDEYDFFPPTWILPQDVKDFKLQFDKKKAKTFIVKPEASCQGKGIFLTRGFEWLTGASEHYVAQRYLHKPYLISGLKFDLRIYVLVTGVNPLRAYITREGLARFATEKYEKPAPCNLNNMMMHLTNYAINKESGDFIFNRDPDRDDVGHKRSLKAVFRSIDNRRHFLKDGETMKSSEEIWQDIKDIILKTLLTAQPSLAHTYKTAKPDDLENSMCFQILGFDVFIDKDSKPWLIEVNHTPSFTTDTPLDFRIKKGLISDSVKMLGLSIKRKFRCQAQKKMEQQKRMLTGFNAKTKITPEEKEQIREKKQALKDKHERENMGQFEHLYPLDPRASDEKNQLYENFFVKAKEVFEETQNQSLYKKKAQAYKELQEVSQKQLDFVKQGPSAYQREKANNQSNAPIGQVLAPSMGGGFKSTHHKQLINQHQSLVPERAKSLLHQQDLLKNTGLAFNSRFTNNAAPSQQQTNQSGAQNSQQTTMNQTQSQPSLLQGQGGTQNHLNNQHSQGVLEMIIEHQENNRNSQQSVDDLIEQQEMMNQMQEGMGGGSHAILYQSTDSPSRMQMQQRNQLHMQNYGKYILDQAVMPPQQQHPQNVFTDFFSSSNNGASINTVQVVNGNASQINGYYSNMHNDFQIINSEDPLAGLIVSRNLDAQFKTEIVGGSGNGGVQGIALRERNTDGKRVLGGPNSGAFIFRNASPIRSHGTTGIRFYQVGDHVNNNSQQAYVMSSPIIQFQPFDKQQVQQYKQKLDCNVTGKHIMTPFQQTLINFQRAQFARQSQNQSLIQQQEQQAQYNTQPSTLYLPNSLVQGNSRSILATTNNQFNKTQQHVVNVGTKVNQFILNSTQQPQLPANSIYQQGHQPQPSVLQQISSPSQNTEILKKNYKVSDKKLLTNTPYGESHLQRKNSLQQHQFQMNLAPIGPQFVSMQMQAAMTPSKMMMMAPPLPPSHMSASKAKGVSTNNRLLLGYTEGKSLKKGQQQQSKRRLAIFGNNMVNQQIPDSPANGSASSSQHPQIQQQSSISYNPILRQALIQLEEPSMTMHGLSINRLATVNIGAAAAANSPPLPSVQQHQHQHQQHSTFHLLQQNNITKNAHNQHSKGTVNVSGKPIISVKGANMLLSAQQQQQLQQQIRSTTSIETIQLA